MNDELVLVQNLIYEIRGKKVMLDSDLAKLYGVETRELKQAVRRNISRFPEDFMFVLSIEEKKLDLLQLQQEENLGAFNDLSEDIRKDIEALYLAIAELSVHPQIQAKREKIGFKRSDED